MFEYYENWKNPETGRMKKHVYLFDGKQMTGVTTVLGVIAKPALIQWAADMACEYVANKFKEIQFPVATDDEIRVWLEEARTAHTKKKEDAGTKGTDVHALVEEYIKTCIEKDGLPIVEAKTGEDPMFYKFRKWAIDNGVRFLASEKKVYSESWFVAGTFDFSFEKDGKRFIGDLKTMGRIWDKVPHAQAAAYRKMSVEMGEKDYDGTCIVNISKPSEKYLSELTESWSYDFETDTKAFEAALVLYRFLQNGNKLNN